MHESLYGVWQLCRAGSDRIFAVFLLFVSHLLDDCAAFRVVSRQSIEMTVEMRTHLSLSLRNKTKAPAVAEYAASGADGKRTHVPERTEPTWFGIKLCQSLLAPGKVVELLIGGKLHLLLCGSVPRNRSVALIKTLRRDLASMIHSHETGSMRLLLVAELALGDFRRRVLT